MSDKQNLESLREQIDKKFNNEVKTRKELIEFLSNYDEIKKQLYIKDFKCFKQYRLILFK